MKRIIILTTLVLAVASCDQIDVEDNQLNVYELKSLYEDMFFMCMGTYTDGGQFGSDQMPFDQRVACMDAVMP